MRVRLPALTVLAAMSAPIVAHSLTLAEGRQPQERPPASFAGPQYVDSRGCVYMRAGYGSVINWVPRIDDKRQVLCGYKPTFPTQMAAASVPAAPQIAPGAPVQHAALALTVTPAEQSMKVAPISIPKGYMLGWTDDRLNPLRAVGTKEGEAQMERIWTNTVPRRLRDVPAPEVSAPAPVAVAQVQRPIRPTQVTDTAYEAPAPRPVAHLSTSNAPSPVTNQAEAAATGRFVQLGAFAVPANAARAAAELGKMGLPVVQSPSHLGKTPVEVVLAGPFDGRAALQAALVRVHGAGFRDAFARN
ncbi:MAG: SPOR domain-containing protein [Paracoccaceae bacterium]|nr:SPOR domain-containing protein [Paracoccaceae bacterium]